MKHSPPRAYQMHVWKRRLQVVALIEAVAIIALYVMT